MDISAIDERTHSVRRIRDKNLFLLTTYQKYKIPLVNLDKTKDIASRNQKQTLLCVLCNDKA